MKLQARDIESFIKNTPKNIYAVLLYGPDEGLIRERANIFTQNIVPDLKDPFNIVEITSSQIQDNGSKLSDELLSISMLGDRKVIRLRESNDKDTSIIKTSIAQLTPDCNFLIVESNDLSPRSSLRLLFEEKDNIATIPCYVEDERNLGKIILSALNEAGYRINSDALNYMSANVVGDRAIARSEIEKLITYMGDEKGITLDDVQACIGNSADLSLNDIAKFVASGNFSEADRILNHILQEGISAVAILRSMQNYFNRVLLTKARIESGDNLDSAIKKLKPAVFFKEKPTFESSVKNWSISAINSALNIIISAEAQCKQTASMPDTICGRVILVLSQMGLKYTGRRR